MIEITGVAYRYNSSYAEKKKAKVIMTTLSSKYGGSEKSRLFMNDSLPNLSRCGVLGDSFGTFAYSVFS